jgi:hypothetical protein
MLEAEVREAAANAAKRGQATAGIDVDVDGGA